MRQPHTAQHVGRLGELNVLVADDLDAIAPGVQKVEERTGEGLDPRFGQCRARGFLIVDDQPEMASVVGGLGASPLERNELVAEIDMWKLRMRPTKERWMSSNTSAC
jgi:hypothetical protein